MATRDISLTDLSAQVFGKYQHCTKVNGEWYADSDLDWRGRPKRGARPRPESKPRHEWPFCEPNPAGFHSGGANFNGRNFRKEETSPGVWQWVPDVEADRRAREYATRKEDLWWALRTRVLTEEELAKVRNYGTFLNVQPMVSYNAHQKELELNAALAAQTRLRILAQQQD